MNRWYRQSKMSVTRKNCPRVGLYNRDAHEYLMINADGEMLGGGKLNALPDGWCKNNTCSVMLFDVGNEPWSSEEALAEWQRRVAMFEDSMDVHGMIWYTGCKK